jgi:hypothetical protein
MLKSELERVLQSWSSLNGFVREANEEQCQIIIKEELATKRRRQFILRAHSRLNKVRADRERQELTKNCL